jgi:hypothetical protein
MAASRQAATFVLALALGLGAAAGAAGSGRLQGIPGPSATIEVNPRLPTTRDPIGLSAAITWVGCPIVFQAPAVTGGEIAIQAAPDTSGPCLPSTVPQTYRFAATLPPLPAGGYTAVLRFSAGDGAAVGFSVAEPATGLLLLGRFSISLSRPDGSPVYAVPLTRASGYFWFFDNGNVEVTVKMVDGRLVNGHFWIFAASMTNVPFTLTVIDLDECRLSPPCVQKVYAGPAGKNTNFLDVNAF